MFFSCKCQVPPGGAGPLQDAPALLLRRGGVRLRGDAGEEEILNWPIEHLSHFPE